MLFFAAFGLGLAFCAPPGAVTAEAVRRGLSRGFRAALLLELGSLVGDAFWAALLWCFVISGLIAWGRRGIGPTFCRCINLLCGLALVLFAAHLAWSATELVV